MLVVLVLVVLPVLVFAQPVPGTYTSAFRGGNVLNGRSSVARQGVNSGNPKIFHGQSWNGSALGTQWEIQCGVETTVTPPDYSQYNAGTGTGFITYYQTFNGGTFTLYTDPNVGWGSGTGNLNVTQATSQVFLQNFVPISRLLHHVRHSSAQTCVVRVRQPSVSGDAYEQTGRLLRSWQRTVVGRHNRSSACERIPAALS
jgi:hypothetical protein